MFPFKKGRHIAMKKIHKVTILLDRNKEKQVRFPIDEEVYKKIKKEPKGVQKEIFTIVYKDYLESRNIHC